MWQPLDKFLRLTLADKLFLFEAFLALIAARMALTFMSFKRIAAWLGTLEEIPPSPSSDGVDVQAERTGWAVGVLAPRVPWDSRCLAQALAGAGMLKRRGIPFTLYLGVRQESTPGISAHAWLRCGERIVTGASGHKFFRIIAAFSSMSGNTSK